MKKSRNNDLFLQSRERGKTGKSRLNVFQQWNQQKNKWTLFAIRKEQIEYNSFHRYIQWSYQGDIPITLLTIQT